MPDYFSFLVCVHKDRTCVYINGLEIGIFEAGVFKTTNLNINGTLIPKTFRNLNVPLKNLKELQQFLTYIINKIDVKDDAENKI